jgi:hypothetical protein
MPSGVPGVPGVPGVSRLPGSVSKPAFLAGDLVHATPLFLIVGVVIAIVSLVIAFLPIDGVFIGIIGYLLTPFSVMVLMGLDTVVQRKKTSSEPWFVPNPNYSKMLRLLAGISLALSYPHISVIAAYISAQLAENAWFASNMSWLF